MTMKPLFSQLLRDERGVNSIEFAVLGPFFLILLLGTFGVGDYMQKNNAIRSAAADASRQVVIAYQRDNTLNEDEVVAIVRGIAVNAPYLLDTDALSITAVSAPSSRVGGTIEFELEIDYLLRDVVPIVPLPDVTV